MLKTDINKIRIIDKATKLDHAFIEAKGKSWFTRKALWAKRQFMRYYFIQPPLWKIILRSKMHRQRMSPGFASIGAVRSGTSLLSDYIMQHPCVVLPLAKEIGLGLFPIKTLIEAQFPTLRDKEKIKSKYGHAVTGYCAPAMPYAGFAQLASKIAQPSSTKIILILRNPVDRTFSHWRWDSMLLQRVLTDPLWAGFPNFAEAMRLELDYISYKGGGLTTVSGVGGGGYIQHSLYLPFLKNLFQFYDKRNALFIKSEDFFLNPIEVAKSVYSFLELPDYEPIETEVKNAGPKAILDDAIRQVLSDFFRPLNEELYEFIGRDLKWQ